MSSRRDIHSVSWGVNGCSKGECFCGSVWGGGEADQGTRGLCNASFLFVLISPNLSESLPWDPPTIGSLSLIRGGGGGGRSERGYRAFRCGCGVLGLMYPVVYFLCPWREARMPLLATTDRGPIVLFPGCVPGFGLQTFDSPVVFEL